MEAFSIDLRERVVRACQQPDAIRTRIAQVFNVSTAFIRRLMQRRRETGCIVPKPRGGRRPKLPKDQYPCLRELVQQQPDATLAELCERLEERTQVRLSDSTIAHLLQKLRLPRKKRRCTPANATASG